MHPIAIQTDQFSLSSYTLLLDLGILLALALFWKRAQFRIAQPERWLDGALVALVGAIFGGRLAYAWAHRNYFAGRENRILKFWQGGLSWQGALIGALVLLFVYCRLRKISFWRLADELALVVPIVGVFSWVGCLMVGCAYGREQDGAHLFAAELPDLFGVWIYRINVQLLAAILMASIGLSLWCLRRKLTTGGLIGLLLFLSGLAFGLTDAMRGDAVPYLGSWRLDVIFDWALVVVGGAILLIGWRKSQHTVRKGKRT